MTAGPPVQPVDVLVPTFGRSAALAVTLAALAAQSITGFRVVVADQTPDDPAYDAAEVCAVARILRHRGVRVDLERNLPRRGLAQQRQFLLECSSAPYVLFLDDDVWLEPYCLERSLTAIRALGCGFVGNAVQGLSYADDVRPHEWSDFEPWAGPVVPERVRRDGPGWTRWRLHNAANPTHLAARLGLGRPDGRTFVPYKVAWVGGCVLYDRSALVDCGGFGFHERAPVEHAGEDVAAQLLVMERYGGAGLLPSGAYHLELPTTVPHRAQECYDLLF